MEKMYLLGFDAGTSASKGTLCDFAGGILATAETPHPVRSPKPGYAEHDPIQDWWHDFIKIVRELLEKSGIDPKQIAGIGVSTVMAGITPVDASGTPLRNAILYGIDSRAQKQIADLNREIGEEALLSICGTLLNMESFGPKIRWIQDNEPEIFRRTHRFTFAAGFLTAKLTGRYCLDRYSARAALPMLDSEKIEWNEELTRFVCRMDQLPEIVNTTDVVGKVTHAAALETGLAEGTPVIAGTTDAGAESISAGITQPGDMMMMYGSTLYMLRLTEKMVRNSGLASGVYVLNNTARLTAGMATAGALLRWMRDELAPDFVAAQNGGG